MISCSENLVKFAQISFQWVLCLICVANSRTTLSVTTMKIFQSTVALVLGDMQ